MDHHLHRDVSRVGAAIVSATRAATAHNKLRRSIMQFQHRDDWYCEMLKYYAENRLTILLQPRTTSIYILFPYNVTSGVHTPPITVLHHVVGK